jgi:hypothetical protein
LVISITSCKIQMLLYACNLCWQYRSLQLRISAKTIDTASHLELPSEYKTWIPAPLLHLNMARCQSGSLL